MTKNYFNEKGVVNFPKIQHGYLIFVFSAILLLTLQSDAFAQKKTPPKTADQILFEISRSGFSRGITSKDVLLVYKNGRVDCESSKQQFRKTSNSKKPKCFQLGKSAIAELIRLAGEPSFIKATDKYDLPGGGTDYSSKRIIVSFLNKNSKTISLNSPLNFYEEDMTDSLPEAVKEFISKIAEIDDSFKLPSR